MGIIIVDLWATGSVGFGCPGWKGPCTTERRQIGPQELVAFGLTSRRPQENRGQPERCPEVFMKRSDTVRLVHLPVAPVLVWISLSGCSPSTNPGPMDAPQDAHDAVVPDLVKHDLLDVRPADVPDSLGPDAPVDVGKELPPSPCVPGTGCFLDKCTKDSDCASGWCVEHQGEGVCTEVCQDQCPSGWSCKYMTGTGANAVFVCISDYANLCRPCSSSEDCDSIGEAEAVCVDYGADGDFCGGECSSTDDCPWAFSCKDVQAVEGTSSKQCVFDAGLCPCTAKSTASAASTTCQVSNEFGSCAGTRTCTQDGLSPCDAPAPAEESCNGIDDDCDGQTDELQYVDGGFLALCDDGNDCTEDSCAGIDGCKHTVLDGDGCDDGDACTGPDQCAAEGCTGPAVACDDGNSCTDDTCAPESGCQSNFNTAPCDDGNGCTTDDTCKEGQCVGKQTVDCKCTSDLECKQFDDEDQCNGALKCIGQQCVTDPTTVVVCDSSNTPACKASICVPETGECLLQAVEDGVPCDDGNKCTDGDACQAGECMSGATVGCDDKNACTEDFCQPSTGCVHIDKSKSMMCNDSNPCTDDGCDPGTGCTHTDNAVPCDDNNKCTTGDACKSGSCTGGMEVSCDDANACTSDTCVPAAGCVHVNNIDPCDDNDPCTEIDLCQGGVCVGGGSPSCDDGNACTKDYCSSPAGCFNKPLTGTPCEDGNLCMTGDLCLAGVCQAGAVPVSCEDGNPCTDNFCDNPAVGCQFSYNEGPCDDGNACTEGDSCLDGKCHSGVPAACNDSNSCTKDSCNLPQGCSHVPVNGGGCESPCLTGGTCHDGSCEGGTPVSCEDDNPCTDDQCDEKLESCQHFDNQGPCEDGDACTEGDFCQGGSCHSGAPVSCDDGNECTVDSCDPAQGCSKTLLTGPVCSDGNLCTKSDKCLGGTCVPGPATDCDDDNPCTDDTCDPQEGCAHWPIAVGCDDGDACTLADMCAGGGCTSGEALGCDDGNVCTIDSCLPAVGCIHQQSSGACNDLNACTAMDACKSGKCVGEPVSCDDQSQCTDDSCDPGTGCQFLPNGLECDDGDACTIEDVCVGGVCVGGATDDCDDLNPCTVDLCANQACQHLLQVDGVPCGPGPQWGCAEGICVCSAACEGKECGLDGCGGPCGTCSEHHECKAGLCQYLPWCGDGQCSDSEGCLGCPEDCGLCKGLGEFCGTASECASGSCADDRCCDSPCLGPCLACNVVSQPGECLAHAYLSDPENGCASCKACDGAGACVAVPKLLDPLDDCALCNACDGVGACMLSPDNTDPGNDCLGCQVCNGAGACRNESAGKDGKNFCAESPQSTCGPDGTCNGVGACRLWPNGTVCKAQSCDGKMFQPADKCDGAGGCLDSGTSDCGAYLCAGTACGTKCSVDADCASGNFCSGSACLAKKDTGLSCSVAAQCKSGYCVDGVCCQNSCSGLCRVCNSTPGTCTFLPSNQDPNSECGLCKLCDGSGSCKNASSGSDPKNQCASSPASSCGLDGDCNGSGACRKWPSGTICSYQSCSGTNWYPTEYCNGSGTCVDSGTKTCIPYKCQGTGEGYSCYSACVSGNQCAPGHGCNTQTHACM